MCEPSETQANPSAADATRAALSAKAPRVQFRRGTDQRSEEDVAFSYTSGNTGGVDIWLISGILCFLVPLVFFAIGIGSGYIDVTPR